MLAESGWNDPLLRRQAGRAASGAGIANRGHAPRHQLIDVATPAGPNAQTRNLEVNRLSIVQEGAKSRSRSF